MLTRLVVVLATVLVAACGAKTSPRVIPSTPVQARATVPFVALGGDSAEVPADIAEIADGTGTLITGLNQDATHDSAALAAGPQTMGDCDDTSTDAVDEGDAGRVRIDCTDRALLTRPIGGTGYSHTSVGSTEDEHAVKATAGVLYSVTVTNINADERYLRCANATAANTSPGSTTPIIDLAIPGNASGAGFSVTFPAGFTFSTALTCWLVTGAAQSDVAEVAANEIKVLYSYR